MFLTLTSTAAHAADLGYLLHKHPERFQTFDLSVGTAHVWYPEATDDRCTVALLLEVDPIGLVRGKRFGGDGAALSQYVNDRPYAASSMLAVALARVFRTAMTGRCVTRPELEGALLPLEIHVPALPSKGGAGLVADLFEPLGWTVDPRPIPLDPSIPAWGQSRYVDLRLRGTLALDQALSHLYVLLPVLDDAKHYWVSTDEIDKLVRAGSAWLADHPQRDLITRRYLAHQRWYVTDATERLTALDDRPAAAEVVPAAPPPNRPLVLMRKDAVLAELRASGAARVVDVGCGEGALLRDLIAEPAVTEILGVDVAHRALERARARLGLDRMSERQSSRLSLLQSSVTYRDARIAGFDAVVLMEVIEHLDLPRLPALERNVFGHARPRTVIVTTPNADFNVRFEAMPPGTRRHPDHRFEWGREQFAGWAASVGASHGYSVRLEPVGAVDPEVGPPTQMAVFTIDGATGGGPS